MPIKLSQASHDEEEARIEIVPLIDIMFFLLASMMLVSLGAVKLKLLKADLPVAVAGNPAKSEPPTTVSVSKDGYISIDGRPVAGPEALDTLKKLVAAKPDVRVVLAADKAASHEMVLHALDYIRGAGIDKVALAAKAADEAGKPGKGGRGHGHHH